jgi:hypothetical protein
VGFFLDEQLMAVVTLASLLSLYVLRGIAWDWMCFFITHLGFLLVLGLSALPRMGLYVILRMHLFRLGMCFSGWLVSLVNLVGPISYKWLLLVALKALLAGPFPLVVLSCGIFVLVCCNGCCCS